MKCDECKNNKFHVGGSLGDVSEGCDDPYNYPYCARDHWIGEGPEEGGIEGDSWEHCPDFEEVNNEMR